MVAPDVASVMVTVCAVAYVPPAGEITGVAAGGRLMVSTEVAVALLAYPLATAMALTVVVELIGIAAVYGVELIVG
jgi:hypothetical protein